MKRKQINGIQITKTGDEYVLRVAKTREVLKTVSTYKEAVDYTYLNHNHLDPRHVPNKRMGCLDVGYELTYIEPNIVL